MDILHNRQMADLTPDEQAKKALSHFIHQLRCNPRLYREAGFMTQTFALVTEAAASLHGEADLKKLRLSIMDAHRINDTQDDD